MSCYCFTSYPLFVSLVSSYGAALSPFLLSMLSSFHVTLYHRLLFVSIYVVSFCLFAVHEVSCQCVTLSPLVFYSLSLLIAQCCIPVLFGTFGIMLQFVNSTKRIRSILLAILYDVTIYHNFE